MRADQKQKGIRSVFDIRFRSVESVTAWPLVLVALISSFAQVARGATYSWQTSAGDWSVASNWSASAVPTASDIAFIADGGTASITLPGAACQYLFLGDPNSANAGTIAMSGGSLSASLAEYLGNQGTGAFVQSAGANSVSYASGHIYLAYGPSSSGSYYLSGSGLLSGGTRAVLTVAYSGTGTFAQSGGTCTFGSLDVRPKQRFLRQL